MADLGYKGIQIPTWDPRMIDLKQASESKTYCDDYKGKLNEIGVGNYRTVDALAGTAGGCSPGICAHVCGFWPG